MNKRLLLLLFIGFWASFSFAQDVLVLNNGNEIPCKVLNISPVTIDYSVLGDESKIKSVARSSVMMILYENDGRGKIPESSSPISSSEPESTETVSTETVNTSSNNKNSQAKKTTEHTQFGIGFNAGFSWLSGVAGGEIEYGHWGIGMGWMPSTMPGSGKPITSISWFLTYQDAVFKQSSGYYISIGSASQGYRSETSYNGGAWSEGFTSPMWIAMLGYKYNWYGGFNAKAACGAGWCEYATAFTWEVTIGFKFGL